MRSIKGQRPGGGSRHDEASAASGDRAVVARNPALSWPDVMRAVTGIEPALSAWEAADHLSQAPDRAGARTGIAPCSSTSMSSMLSASAAVPATRR